MCFGHLLKLTAQPNGSHSECPWDKRCSHHPTGCSDEDHVEPHLTKEIHSYIPAHTAAQDQPHGTKNPYHVLSTPLVLERTLVVRQAHDARVCPEPKKGVYQTYTPPESPIHFADQVAHPKIRDCLSNDNSRPYTPFPNEPQSLISSISRESVLSW